MTTAPQLNDVEAEKALIGAVLILPAVVSEIEVRTSDFYSDRHRLIWGAISDIARDQKSPDVVTVAGRLGADRLDKIGGEQYLTELVTSCPNATNYQEYANQVSRIAKKRDALNRVSKIATLVAKADTTPETIAEVLQDQAREYANSLDTEEQESRDPWIPYFIADALQERPPIEYIAAGLFPLSSLNIVYGAPGCLKSFLLADLAISAAMGELWLPPAPWQPGSTGFQTRQAPVMWIDFDNGVTLTHERIGALARARSTPGDAPFYYYTMPTPWLDANNPDSVGMLALRAKNHAVKMIVIDNLGTVSGGVDENSGAMITVMGNLRRLAEDTGAAVIVIHHQRKANGFTGRAGDSLRGHSSIEAAIDLALHVEREQDSDTVTIKSTKTRGVDVLPFSAVLTYTHRIGSDDMETARFYGIATADTSSNRALEAAILDALDGKSLNQAALASAVKAGMPDIGLNRIRDYINRMEKNKILSSQAGAKNAKVYFIA